MAPVNANASNISVTTGAAPARGPSGANTSVIKSNDKWTTAVENATAKGKQLAKDQRQRLRDA